MPISAIVLSSAGAPSAASASNESQLNVEMQESILRILATGFRNRPPNTSKAYSSRQQEFHLWCDTKGFIDGRTVTGTKLHLFLEDQVIGRNSRKKKQGDNIPSRNVGRSTVFGYTAAIVDLWRQQTAMGMNSHPNPRDSNVKRLLKNAEYQTHQNRRNNFDDRGVGTPIDGYTTLEQMVKIAEVYWQKSRDFGPNLRNMTAFFISHYALLPGESVRQLEFSDMHSVLLENEGLSPCHALVFVLRQGKANKFGRNEFGAFMRSKDVRICPFGSIAIYLFWRIHVECEPFPCFETSERWFNLKLLKSGSNPTKALGYRMHKSSIESVFKEIGLSCKAKTHAGRGSAARMAELAGASEDQIRRLGSWNNQALDNCYLTSLPREAMRTLAGFPPQRGSFYLSRAAIDPPVNLKGMIFPQIEGILQKLSDGSYQHSIAARGFLDLLKLLRTVFLQDSVMLRVEHPDHPVWKHSIFSTETYCQFEQDLRRAMSTDSDPTENLLQRAMPMLSENLSAVHSDLKASILTAVGPLAQCLYSLQGQTSDVFSGKDSISLNADFGSRVSLENAVQGPSFNAVDVDREPVPLSTMPPNYKMARGIQSVPELWKEWTDGVAGGPAVKDLERKWGSKWCEGNERRFYNRRKKIIEAIETLAGSMPGGVTVDNCCSAACIIERIRQTKNKSLDWLSKNTDSLS